MSTINSIEPDTFIIPTRKKENDKSKMCAENKDKVER